ncbi:NAD(P)-binding domain protein [Niveomyces insectorum RCEF 264]|uniref:NAD(P)-binding domain protein n=1 Tax=Niveomyces insectorum RCEF 264 TaxID=1081102 RepID=A0A168AEF9_9HYPO|nr:NAD(P)-binding domain protein [Niveomyces insectorum RCEF 264]
MEHASPECPSRPSRTLSGKVALVTGAGAQGDGIGNGRAIAILLAEDGASVVCVDRVLALAQRTVAMIEDGGGGGPTKGDRVPGKAIAVEADVTSEPDCQRIVDTALSTFGRVDILCNNVGIMGATGPATELDTAQWAQGLEVNVTSMMLMARCAIPAMLKNDTAAVEAGHPSGSIRGSIVNLGSVAGLQGGTPHLLYPTAKGAVVNMTRAMAAHHGRDGIRVNCVCPGERFPHPTSSLLLAPLSLTTPGSPGSTGMLYTPMMYHSGMSAEMRERRRNRSLLRTEGNAWDCASAVRFLAGDEARWITGTVLTVDAGATAAGFV